MSDCIFCEIISGNIPAYKVYEDDKTLAFLDINPTARGHILVVPKEHSRNLLDIHDEDMAAVGKVITRGVKALKMVTNCDGINLLQTNEPAAMQEVFHTHFHLIPRWTNDDIRFSAPRRELDPAAAKELVESLQNSF
ncbi:MAG: HIT family protein [Candidatus Heimdallarchaeota archaeon]